MPRNLLIVDDEPHVVRSLYALLRHCPYNILTVTDAVDGLKMMRCHEIGVVISDFRMPGMNGAEFLAEVCRCSPHTYRILLTGQADFESMMAAVNAGAVHKFLLKPWDSKELPLLLEEAFQHYELTRENHRLTLEIQTVNTKLRELNAALAEQVTQKSRELDRALNFDAVTQLPNRLLALDRLTEILSNSSNQQIAVIILDLDDFKLVNDCLGHPLGNKILRLAAERLSRQVRGGEFVARVGNDEFCMILTGDDEQNFSSRIEAILTHLEHPEQLTGQQILLKASAGIAVSPRHGTHAEILLRRADTSLRYAKRNGGNPYLFYQSSFDEDGIRHLTMAAELERALHQNEFTLYLQPKVDLVSGRIIGAEALIRWMHPERGLMAPGEFIPILEETNLIIPVGEWVMAESCRMIKRLQRQALELPLAINLSLRQLQQVGLVDTIHGLVGLHGLIQEAFPQLEITESVLMHEGEQGLSALRRLHDQLGFKLALDDFGTGYSSLAYLTSFPIDYLKIDRTFVQKIGVNAIDEAIIHTITNLARHLNLQVIAEGVETPPQLEFLRHAGCHQVQGYLLSPPLPEQDFISLLKTWDPGGWRHDQKIVAATGR